MTKEVAKRLSRADSLTTQTTLTFQAEEGTLALPVCRLDGQLHEMTRAALSHCKLETCIATWHQAQSGTHNA